MKALALVLLIALASCVDAADRADRAQANAVWAREVGKHAWAMEYEEEWRYWRAWQGTEK